MSPWRVQGQREGDPNHVLLSVGATSQATIPVMGKLDSLPLVLVPSCRIVAARFSYKDLVWQACGASWPNPWNARTIQFDVHPYAHSRLPIPVWLPPPGSLRLLEGKDDYP